MTAAMRRAMRVPRRVWRESEPMRHPLPEGTTTMSHRGGQNHYRVTSSWFGGAVRPVLLCSEWQMMQTP